MRFTMTFAVVALLALGAVLGLAACGSDDSGGGAYGGASTSTTTDSTSTGENETAAASKPAVETIVVRNGEPVGGVAELTYSAGEEVRFEVRSDVADEVHIHGYDLTKDVPAGGTVSFSFPAELEGLFEVELEQRVEQIAELRVNP